MLLFFSESLSSLLVNKLVQRKDGLYKKLLTDAIHNTHKCTVLKIGQWSKIPFMGHCLLYGDSNYTKKAAVQRNRFCKKRRR